MVDELEPLAGRIWSGFSSLNGSSVAVILQQGAKQFVQRGTAVFQWDDALGNLLIIALTDPQPGDPKVIISEREWKGRIVQISNTVANSA